jgi:hypothetical protein
MSSTVAVRSFRCAEAETKDRAGQDVHGDLRQGLEQIERCARVGCSVPGAQALVRSGGHRIRDRGEPLAVELRLDQPPLSQPEIALADDQTVAADRAECVPLRAALMILVAVVDQDVLGMARMVADDEARHAEVERVDVAVARPRVEQELELPTQERGQCTDERQTANARRQRLR